MPVYKQHNQGGNFAKSTVLSLSILAIILTLNGCASTEEIKQNPVAEKVDPYENINRKVYHFNDSVDNYVAKPISDAYRFVTPQIMQTGVFNFFNNLKNINVVINDVLQAKFKQSAKDTGRLALNTTLGLGGLFDVAKDVGFEQNDEDFEQTLAVWGVPQGSYLVIPFIGPSTARGIPGSVFDTATNPSTYVGWPVQLVSMLNTRANAEGSLKFIDEAALDPYVFTRESFLQWRNNLASDGKSSAATDVAEFDEELSADDKKPAAASQTPAENQGKSDQKPDSVEPNKQPEKSGKTKQASKHKTAKGKKCCKKPK